MMSIQNNVIPEDSHVLESLWYFPLGNHVPVFNRPYVVNADANAIGNLTDRMVGTGAVAVGSQQVADISAQLIQPNPTGEISTVDNNFLSQPRFVFILKVRSICVMGEEYCSYIQGYTDHNGITNTGAVDFNMVHRVNTIIETFNLSYPTPMGMQHRERLNKVYSVLGAMEHEFYTQRPTDIIGNIDLLEMSNVLGMSDISVDTHHTTNTVNQFNNNAIASKAENAIPSNYLSNVINGGINKLVNQNLFTDSFNSFTAETTNHNPSTMETSLYENRFLKSLTRITGNIGVRDNFSFGSLAMLDETIADRFKLIYPDKRQMDPTQLNTPETGEYWGGQDPITLKAYSLIEACVSLASRHGFSQLSFMATNINPTRQVSIGITKFNSFTNLEDHDKAQLLELFKNKLTTEIFIPETNAGFYDMFMEMHVDLLGTSKINLSFCGMPETWYTIPTGVNSLFSSVLTFDKNALDAVTSNFNTLITEVANNTQTPGSRAINYLGM